MKYFIFAGLLCISSCSIFKFKHEIDDVEKLAADFSVLEKKVEPEVEKLIQDFRNVEELAAPDLYLIINDGKKVMTDFQS